MQTQTANIKVNQYLLFLRELQSLKVDRCIDENVLSCFYRLFAFC